MQHQEKCNEVRSYQHFFLIENKIELLDIPFCDRFFVLERWMVETEAKSLNTSVTEDEHSVSTQKENEIECRCRTVHAGKLYLRKVNTI